MNTKVAICFLIAFSNLMAQNPMNLTREQAQKIIQLPMNCIEVEFPNKTGQTLSNATDLGTPKELHPAFYGCFDWHSAVHGYWSIIEILKLYPELNNSKLESQLLVNLSAANIQQEIAYFNREQEYSYERTYGWAWLLKLQLALNQWNTPTGKQLSINLQPLSDLIVEKYLNYLPKLQYPLRVGTHNNTAFGLSFAWDYAESQNHEEFKTLITKRAKDFYLKDINYPLNWEPDGYDFLSPGMEEIDLMRKVLNPQEFESWINQFLPQLKDKNFDWEVAIVSDRTDGHLVHLDGLNYSRAWVFFGLAKQYPEFQHLIPLGEKHFNASYADLLGDTYEGGHWLGTFALQALLSYSALKP